jgi:predicted transcriptional regulator
METTRGLEEQEMSGDPASALGKRERQIMDILYRHGRATASQVLAELPEAPTYSTVRAMLRYLEEKGLVSHEQDGPRYVYRPTKPKGEVRASALSHVVRTFFDGSVTTAVATLLEAKPLSRKEHERLSQLLADAALRLNEE